MELTPQGPAHVGRVLDDAWRLYAAAFGRVWYLAGLGSFLTNVPMSISQYALSNGDLGIGQFFGLMLIFVAVWFVILAAVLARMGAVADGIDLPVVASLTRGLRRSFYLFVAMVLYVLAMYLGLILLLIPGIAVSVFFVLFPVLIVREGMNPFAALGESWVRIWGRWWRTLLVLSVGVVLWMIGYALVGAVASGMLPFLSVDIGFSALIDTSGTMLIYTTVIQVVSDTLFSPLLYAVLIVQSDELGLRWRGRDLERRIRALAA